MSKDFNYPIAVSHMGKIIYLVSAYDADNDCDDYYYNVLELKLDSDDDANDWAGYRKLTIPDSVSPAGMGLVSVKQSPKTTGYFQAVSDQQYVYLFRATERAIYANRYMLVEAPSEEKENETVFELQPAWQVRFQRSKKADVPANQKDSQSFLNMEGLPFIEPVKELPFGGAANLNLGQGAFAVVLTPTMDDAKVRWQLFVVDGASQQLLSYSFARSDNGWFVFNPEQVDPTSKNLLPDAAVELQLSDGTALPFTGIPAAAVYLKQEPVVTKTDQVVNMKRSARLLLSCQSAGPDEAVYLSALDFAVASNGVPAWLEPADDFSTVFRTFKTGQIEPAGFVLQFDGLSWVQIPAGDPLILGNTFTQECWIFSTATDVDEHLIVGSIDGVEDKNLPPSIWVQDKQRVSVGFGDGDALLTTTSKNNVLSPNSWNHVAFVFDGKNPLLYVNAVNVELQDNPFADKTPAATALTGIGGQNSYFKGMLDEMRVWNSALSQADIEKYLYQEIPDEVAKGLANLVGYWRLDQGSGAVANDVSAGNRDAALHGAKWKSASAPLAPASAAAPYIDDKGLALYAGVIVPDSANPLFGNIQSGSRPQILSSADGLLHVYYQGANGEFLAAQYDATIARAYYQSSWLASAVDAGDNQSGSVLFSARQTGTVLNNASIAIKANTNPLLCDVSIDDGLGAQETWTGVPRLLNQFLDVMNGKAISEASDPNLAEAGKVFYDYDGGKLMAVQAQGDALFYGHLLMVSRNTDGFAFLSMDVSGIEDSSTDCEVALSFSSDTDHPGETLNSRFSNVPIIPGLFVQTINGSNGDYDYDAYHDGDAKCYSLTAGNSQILVFIPDSSVQAAQFVITLASQPGNKADPDPQLCTATIKLTVDTGQPVLIEATWDNISRTAEDFAEAIKNSESQEQKQVAQYLRFFVADPGALVVDADVTDQAGLTAFSSLLQIINHVRKGSISNFSLTSGAIQKAAASKESADLTLGSNIFASLIETLPDNGYPAVLEDASATLFKPGQDGGWMPESPRNAVEIVKDSGLSVAIGEVVNKPLAIEGSLTVEAWVNVLPSQPMSSMGQPVLNQRILAANLTDDAQGPRYMLGLKPTYALQILRNTLVKTDDKGIPAGSESLKLFPGADYCVQLYMRPNLDTIESANKVYVRTSPDDSSGYPSESLTLNKDGTLTLVVALSQNQSQSAPTTVKIQNQTWTMLTLVRSGGDALVYQDGVETLNTQMPAVSATNSAIQLGGNSEDLALEMELNQFSIWKRVLPSDEVRANYYRRVPNDDQGLQLLWGLDDYNTDGAVANTALATQGYYNTTIENHFFWDLPGIFYRAFAGCRQIAVQTTDAIIPPDDWNHYSMIYDGHYGLSFDGGNYGDCGNDSTLNTDGGISVSAWIKQSLTRSGLKQVIFSKYGSQAEDRSYEFGLDVTNKPYITVRITGQKQSNGDDVEERLKLHTFTGAAAVKTGQAYYLCATVQIVEIADVVSDQSTKSCYSVSGQIYVNGAPQIPGPATITPSSGSATSYAVSVIGGSGSGRYTEGAKVTISATDISRFTGWKGDTEAFVDKIDDTTVTFDMPAQDLALTAVGVYDQLGMNQSDTSANIARTQAGDTNPESAYFYGDISDLSLWSDALPASDVSDYYQTRVLPAEENGLISIWRFTEQQGSIAVDDHYDNNALLSSSEMWIRFHDSATLQLLVNGQKVPTSDEFYGDFDGYGAQQFNFGYMLDEVDLWQDQLQGSVDEIRVWNEVRTAEQINDNMQRSLAGNEAYLQGYWRFDVGSGNTVMDQTGNGNNAVFTKNQGGSLPNWVASTAPVNNEAAEVLNVLGGQATKFLAAIDQGPASVEYADTQFNSRGEMISIFKRCYIYKSGDEIKTVTGYKVGDLYQVYLGQIQTKPTLIGYIEGAPPLPSENLTGADHDDPTAYYGASSVALQDSEDVQISLSGSREKGSHLNFGFKIGLKNDNEITTGVAAGVGVQQIVLTKAATIEGQGGVATNINWSESETKGSGVATSSSRTNINSLESLGDWEAPDANGEFLLPGERRFIPANTGYAMVMSSTADLYSLHMLDSGAMVSMVVVPNLNIPEDVNIIHFPINAEYIKNGTLDGKVGLQNDPQYPDANIDPGSYFKPVEAYTLKRKVERQTNELAAYYGQFNAASRGKSQDEDLTSEVEENPYYNWEQGIPRKDMVNTYVWTAAGGLHSEQESYTNMRQESRGGSYEFSWDLGAFTEWTFAVFGVGLFLESEIMGGTNWTVNVEKQKEEQTAIELQASVSPSQFLGKYLDKSSAQAYDPEPVPGKVNTYRFMTFYLSPSTDNTDEFFSKIVDQTWLQTSQSPDASAMREARASSDGKAAWRVLHRVTFVSRVPPKFQVYPDDTNVVEIDKPVNLGRNTVFLELVRQRLNGNNSPSAAEIGAAVREVINTDLVAIIPWWQQFLDDAATPNSEQFDELTSTIASSILYTDQYYLTKDPAV